VAIILLRQKHFFKEAQIKNDDPAIDEPMEAKSDASIAPDNGLGN
jgi:hypothetical protein